jgi:hypothetical protein
MKEFPHLPIIKREMGKPRRSRGGKKDQTTLNNKRENVKHGNNLLKKINSISFETTIILGDGENKFEYTPISKAVFLTIDPNEIDIEDYIQKLGLELISEEEKGFIIGSGDNESFDKLKGKIQKFILEGKYKSYIPELWEIEEGKGWQLEHILSMELLDEWDKLKDLDILTVELSIAVNQKNEELKNLDQESQFQLYDTKSLYRQNLLESFLKPYSGSLESDYIDCNDSFSCIVRISVKGLKDILFNYPYLFEVTRTERVESQITIAEANPENLTIQFTPPDENDPAICIIDSGIQENHKYISDAVISGDSMSFLTGNPSTADHVGGGGHGTRIAGVVALGIDFAKNTKIKHELRIQNARVLDDYNMLAKSSNPAKLMRKIVNHYHKEHGTRIFNLSINSSLAFARKYMSTWAAEIDKLTYENDILFIISVGNISIIELRNYYQCGIEYPDYFNQKQARIANPAISCFSISVGSIAFNDYEIQFEESIATKDAISAFSRCGPGLWGMIKPDIVSYGGDYVKEKSKNGRFIFHAKVCPTMIRSTLNGGPAVSADNVGTSFSAPQISRLAGLVAKEFPDESTLFYRALIGHSTEELKVKGDHDEMSIRLTGYGKHCFTKFWGNNSHRITFYSSELIGADETIIYCVNIPDALRQQSLRSKYLIEITLAYKAKPRRTRQKTKSYLSTWLSWETSKIDESFNNFTNRIKAIEEEYDNDGGRLKWRISQNKKTKQTWGGRNDSTLQKDWCIIDAYNLNAEFAIAVKGHKGWDKSGNDKVEYSIIVSLEDQSGQLQVYEQIKAENQIVLESEIEIST